MHEEPKIKTGSTRELSSDCNSIELNNGKATSLLGLADNYISTNVYLSNDLFMRPLFRMINLCPISLAISIFVAITISDSQPYTRWMYGTEFILIFLTKIAKQFYFDKMRSQADQKINNSKFMYSDSKVYRDGEEMVDMNWGNIKEGDILYLQKGQKAPADLLVLDTQHIEDRQAIVYVDERSITGKVTVQRKRACYLTQVTSRSAVKRNWDKYRKEYLTGKLKYELPSPNMQQFVGYLKLVKDPKTSEITFQNFISRQSIIKTCWIYAIVVNAGMNCKIMRHISERSRNHKFFENKVDRIFSVCFLINIILGIPFALLEISKGSGEILRAFAYHFMLFSIILPHFLFLGDGLLLLYFSLKNNIEAEIMNYSNIINLGCIDYAIMAYNGVLSSGKMYADQIVTSSSLYDLGEDNEEIIKTGSRRSGSHIGSKTNKRGNRTLMSICNSAYADMNTINSPLPLNKIGNSEFDQYFLDDESKPGISLRLTTGLNSGNTKNVRISLEPLKITKQKLKKNVLNAQDEAMGLIVAFGLCHQAILKSVDSVDFKFEANSKIYSQQVLLRLVNNVGIHVSCQIDSRTKKQKAIRIKIQDLLNEKQSQNLKEKEKQLFYSRKQNNFLIERKIFSVVTRKDGSEQRVIYCKGSPEDMLEKLKDREVKKNLIENHLSKFKQNKAQIIIYGKRNMHNEEYQIYENEYTKLKMSNNVTLRDIQDFSAKFQRDLDFVCMVGLCSEKKESMQDIVEYIWNKGIKMCVFTNNMAEVNSLKTLLKQQNKCFKKDEQLQYIELEGRSVQQITYNLNNITRKLNYERQYSYSLVIGRQCWKILNTHSSLLQHFLFALYYSCNVLAYGFNPLQKAQLAQKIKRSYNRNQTIMSIGSSYSDLYFQNFSDVSLIISSCDGQKTHSDIPSDIRALNINSLKKIIELGSWVTSAYNYLLGVSIYRSALIGAVAFVLQTVVAAYQGTSYNLDSKLVFLYVVVYGALETLFVIKLEYKKHKQVLQYNDFCIKDKKTSIKFWSNVIEGIIHGVTIGIVVLLTLPNARLSGGKIFPVEAIHFSIYILMISVSIFRHFVNGECKRIYVLVLAGISYPILLGLPWLIVIFRPHFARVSLMMGVIWLSYDSVLMLINSFIFCLACSLFIVQAKQKGIISILLQHFLKLKKQNAKQSKELLNKDTNHIELVKYLFKDEQSIQDSIQELVGTQFDTNQLKIDTFLQFKKTEHKIKNEFNNTGLNLGRFKLTIVIVITLFIVDIVHGLVIKEENVHWKYQLPLYISIVILSFVFIWYIKYGCDIGRKYYAVTKICIFVICVAINIYQLTNMNHEEHFLLTCVLFGILTQLVGVHLLFILIFILISYIVGLVSVILGTIDNYSQRVPFYIVFMTLCGIINSAVLYSSAFDSRKNFILRQQIQMQTNQTNDIWTILVPQFVRNLFAQNGEYKQKSVAILFCYVCNFNAIIEQQGRNVVRLLDNLYRQFDKVCSSFAVQKIQTVGYTYMAASGIRKIETQMENDMVKRNKVERLVGMAQQMLEKTKMFKWGVKKNKDLQIKIGIHVGQVVVGVIGKHKKQFSLIGTNVNTTSRHGSTGQEGSIVLSRQAKAELHHFPAESFVQRFVYMKGLCKTEDQKIPVYIFKATDMRKRANKSSLSKSKFKKLVMRVIRQQRCSNQINTEELFEPVYHMASQTNAIKVLDQRNSMLLLREHNQRLTCRGLEINFNKIQEMKKRQDQTKCYSSLLQLDLEEAKKYYEEIYPNISNQQLQRLVAKEIQIDNAYIEHLEKNRGLRDELFIFTLLALNVCLLISNIILYEYTKIEIGFRVAGILFLVIVFFLTKIIHKKKGIAWIFVIIFTYLLTLQKVDSMSQNSQLTRSFSHFYSIMIVTLCSAITGFRFMHSLVLALQITLFLIISIAIMGYLQINSIYEWFYVLLVMVRKYVFQKQSIINFRQGQKTAQISKELNKIVSELLPKHAYQKLKTQNFENRLELTDLFEQCTILFADIKGFTEFSDKPQNKADPTNVVKMLRSLFEQFDMLCTVHNVYKVYTIGDCYVVLGFTNCYDRNPKKQAENVVNFGFDMIKIIEKVKREKPQLSMLNMRIGVHTGTIIGGIVGTDIVRYDIYGSDVVVANKFEETGKIGKIHISQQTKKLLDQLQKKPYPERNIEQSEQVQIKKLNVSYKGYFIQRGNLS